MQRPHSVGHMFWRVVVASAANGAMLTGVYPLVPSALLAWSRRQHEAPPLANWRRAALTEWKFACKSVLERWRGFSPLPGSERTGVRPVILLHGYAMSRACFTTLARRLEQAGHGPIYGFEYWSLGRVSTAAKRLAEFVAEVRSQTGCEQVDLIGHSMGGVVARYYVTLGGGDGVVAHLVTLGSPHLGTEFSIAGIGRSRKELVVGSSLTQRLRFSKLPTNTKVTVIWSKADSLVPSARQARIDGVRELVFDDVGHIGLLESPAVAKVVLECLGE